MKKNIKKIISKFYTYLSYFQSKNKAILNARVNGLVKINKNTVLGNNVNLNGCKIYGQGYVTIGDNFHSAKGLVMLTTYHNHQGTKIPYDQTVSHKHIIIEDNVWVGLNVIILGGVTIGEGSIIQAGSVVSQSLPALSIAGGNPATPFKTRDAEHYYKLKAEKQFH